MKNLYLFLIFFSNFISSQNTINWELLSPKPTGNAGKDLHFLDESHGFYITGSELVETKNSGETWSIVKKLSNASNFDAKGNHAIITENYLGQLQISHDGLNTWQIKNTGISESFIYSKVFDDNNYLVASKNQLFFSTNGGDNWVSKPITVTGASVINFVNANVGFIGTSNGKIYKTIDGGQSWVLKDSVNIIPSDFFTMYFYSESLGFAVRGHGDILKTTDGGESWVVLNNNNIGGDVYSFHFLTESVGYIVGEYGLIFKTTDGGSTWTNRFFQNAYVGGSSMLSVFFQDENKGFAVGQRGRILKTDNGGVNWKEYAPFYNDVNVINKVNDNVYAKVGWDIYKSKDYGSNWQLLNRPTDLIPENPYWTTQYSRDIKFINDDVGYIIGGNSNGDSKFFKTTDGGNSWILKKDFDVYGLNDFDFLNENLGYVCGGQGTMGNALYKTTDGGNNWVLINSNIQFRKIKILSENVVYASDYSHLYKSNNGGTTWTLLYSYDNQEISDFFFVDENNGFLLGDPDVNINRTTDGGQTWIKEEIEYDWYKLVRFMNKNIGIVVDEEGDMLISYNGGRSWKQIQSQFAYNDLLFSNSTMLLAGNNGRILQGQLGVIPSNVLYTKEITEYYNDRAKVKGSAASNSDYSITNLRFQVSKTPNFSQPIYFDANILEVATNDSNDLKADLENLDSNQKYYVRLVGQQNSQTVYGNSVNFTTLPDYSLQLNNAYSYLATSVDLSGLGTASGNDITNLEFEYSENVDQFTNSAFSTPQNIVMGNSNVSLTSKLQSLKPQTLYYARIKAKYENNVIYSNMISFTTAKEYDITLYEAYKNGADISLNANISANDKDITDITFEYGFTDFENSVIASPAQVSGSNSAYLSAIISANSLATNKNYYARIKAVTNGKIIYSNIILFNLNNTLILTKDKNEILSETSIKLNGLIKAFDYYPVTDIKFEYGKTENLGNESPSTPNYSYYSTSTLKITSNLTGLETNQKYYYKISAIQNGEKKYSDLYEFTLTPLSVSDINKSEIAIYPNPVREILHFKSSNNISKIEIYDLSGKLLLAKSAENIDNVNLQNLSNAIYIIKIYSKDEVFTKKIIKQ